MISTPSMGLYFFFINYPDRFLPCQRYTLFPLPFFYVSTVGTWIFRFLFVCHLCFLNSTRKGRIRIPFHKDALNILPHFRIFSEFLNHRNKNKSRSLKTTSLTCRKYCTVQYCGDDGCLLIRGKLYLNEIVVTFFI